MKHLTPEQWRTLAQTAPVMTPELARALWEEGQAMRREIQARFAKMKILTAEDFSSRAR
jgi:hypothetical protein